MVVGSLVFVSIPVWNLGCQIHFLHQTGNSVQADLHVEAAEKFYPEGTFPGDNAISGQDHLTHFLTDSSVLDFLSRKAAVWILLASNPGIVSGMRNAKHFQAGSNAVPIFLFLLTLDKRVGQSKAIRLQLLLLKDIDMASNSDCIFFCAMSISSR